jgi:hypothetical protein
VAGLTFLRLASDRQENGFVLSFVSLLRFLSSCVVSEHLAPRRLWRGSPGIFFCQAKANWQE